MQKAPATQKEAQLCYQRKIESGEEGLQEITDESFTNEADYLERKEGSLDTLIRSIEEVVEMSIFDEKGLIKDNARRNIYGSRGAG